MPSLPEQAGLVALLYRADWTRLSLSATLHHQSDWALRSRLNGERAAERMPGPLVDRPSWWPFPWPWPGPGAGHDSAGRGPWPGCSSHRVAATG